MPELPLAEVICAVYAPGLSVRRTAVSALGFGRAMAPVESAAAETAAGLLGALAQPVFWAMSPPLLS